MHSYKPTSPGRRHLKSVDLSCLSRSKPHKALTSTKTSAQGRNVSGHITSRAKGGKGKRLCRNIDLWYAMRGQKASSCAVLDFFYDPNRTAYLALIVYLNGPLYGTKRYIIATSGVQKGDLIRIGAGAPLAVGNILPLSVIPVGSDVSCIELLPGKGAQLVRAAGTKAKLLLTNEKYAAVRLPSKEIRLIPNQCFAVLGSVPTPEHNRSNKAKAGRVRWLGRRPKVRGSAMNPIDHPHGGGEGRCPIGRRSPVTPWGKPALGINTRDKNKHRFTDKLILKRRNS